MVQALRHDRLLQPRECRGQGDPGPRQNDGSLRPTGLGEGLMNPWRRAPRTTNTHIPSTSLLARGVTVAQQVLVLLV